MPLRPYRYEYSKHTVQMLSLLNPLFFPFYNNKYNIVPLSTFVYQNMDKNASCTMYHEVQFKIKYEISKTHKNKNSYN